MTEYQIYSLMRSGHHAVCNWIYQNLPGSVIYANDVKNRLWNHDSHDNRLDQVIEHFTAGRTISDDLVNISCPIKLCKWYPLLCRGFNPQEIDLTKPCVDYLLHAIEDDPMISFENGKLTRTKQFNFVPKKSHKRVGIGTGSKLIQILILRDPCNFISSRMKRKTNFDLVTEGSDFWKTQAREFLRYTKILNDPILINFNAWVCSQEYRNTIGEQLNLIGDTGTNQVPLYGKGSSFTGYTLDPPEVLYRYKQCPEFINYLDEEAIDLGKEIFGKYPPFTIKDFRKTEHKLFL